MTEIVLETRNITKRFGRLLVTNDVSLKLARGARHALIGPNGAGKTTLIGLLSGTLRPDEGSIFIEDVDVTGESALRRVRRGLGRTFQITNLFSGLTILENLYIVLSEREGTSASIMRPAWRLRSILEEAHTVLNSLGIASTAPKTVSEVSYGEQRLVEVALALCLRPKILLLDEPAAGIPSSEMSRVMSAIENLPTETAILLIEHDMAIVRQLATEVSVLVEGSILESGTPREILASEKVRDVYLGRRQSKNGGCHA